MLNRIIIISVSIAVLISLIIVYNTRSFSQESISNDTTIKITSEASTNLNPDQAIISVSFNSKPDKITSILEEQDNEIENIKKLIYSVDDNATVTINHRNIYQYYMPIRPSQIFNVRSVTTIDMNTTQLHDVVNKVVESGFGFENIYLRTDGKKSTIRVTIDTKPDLLNNTLAEYKTKYDKLLSMLEEMNITEDDITRGSINIYPTYMEQASDIYEGIVELTVKTSIDNIELINNIIRNNTNASITNIRIFMSDEAIEEARKTLTKEAIDNAWKRASEIVEPLGFRVKSIKSIENVYGQSPSINEAFYKGVKFFEEHGNLYSNNISVSVTVEFLIEKI